MRTVSSDGLTYNYTCIQGVQGPQGEAGETGEKGEPGEAGVSIDHTDITYGISESEYAIPEE